MDQSPLKVAVEGPKRIHKTPFGSISIYQIYFDEFSRSQMDPGFTSIYNGQASPLLESDVLDWLLSEGAHKEADFFGLFSWKAKLKLGIGSTMTYSFLDQIRYDCDVMTFPFDPIGPNAWTRNTSSGVVPSDFLNAGQILMDLMEIDVDLQTLKTPIIYQNAFVARSWVMERFYQEMLKPALVLLKDVNQTELQEALSMKASYPVFGSIRMRILKAFGNSYFTHHPFVAEVLFPTWLALQPQEIAPRIYVPSMPKIRAGTMTGGAC